MKNPLISLQVKRLVLNTCMLKLESSGKQCPWILISQTTSQSPMWGMAWMMKDLRTVNMMVTPPYPHCINRINTKPHSHASDKFHINQFNSFPESTDQSCVAGDSEVPSEEPEYHDDMSHSDPSTPLGDERTDEPVSDIVTGELKASYQVQTHMVNLSVTLFALSGNCLPSWSTGVDINSKPSHCFV